MAKIEELLVSHEIKNVEVFIMNKVIPMTDELKEKLKKVSSIDEFNNFFDEYKTIVAEGPANYILLDSCISRANNINEYVNDMIKNELEDVTLDSSVISKDEYEKLVIESFETIIEGKLKKYSDTIKKEDLSYEFDGVMDRKIDDHILVLNSEKVLDDFLHENNLSISSNDKPHVHSFFNDIVSNVSNQEPEEQLKLVAQKIEELGDLLQSHDSQERDNANLYQKIKEFIVTKVFGYDKKLSFDDKLLEDLSNARDVNVKEGLTEMVLAELASPIVSNSIQRGSNSVEQNESVSVEQASLETSPNKQRRRSRIVSEILERGKTNKKQSFVERLKDEQAKSRQKGSDSSRDL